MDRQTRVILGFLLMTAASVGMAEENAADIPAETSGKTPAEPLSVPGNAYRLHEGDVIQVSVWHEEGMERELRVLPDGSITFPLAGRVEVAGLAAPEVEQRIAEKLKEFIPEPTVTVVIAATDGSLVYVAGKVNKPGPIPLRGPMTVMQALSLAGGPTTFANEGSIVVIRPAAHGEEILPVDYDDLLDGDDLSTNIQLKAGDTIQVP